ncbi:ribosylnicotinamide kinase [Taxawa tesnikishii (nom. ined.)]|nr:ribosylnicotinamide kinase [Dothideales sp. JES 119]
MSTRRCLLVGISGVSSSGKTTLARLLRDIIPNTFILHEDDFYKTDKEIPIKNGVADWDCLESINLPEFEQTLKFIKDKGALPPDFQSKEDQNSVGEAGVNKDVVEQLKKRTHVSLHGRPGPSVAIIDGFLLFSEEMKAVRDLFDIKLFLRTDYKTAKARREARSGYVTLEGFWEDPPGYVDKVVWPNYVNDHAFYSETETLKGHLMESCGINGVIGVTEVSDGDTSLFVVITGDFSMIKMDVMPGSFMAGELSQNKDCQLKENIIEPSSNGPSAEEAG